MRKNSILWIVLLSTCGAAVFSACEAGGGRTFTGSGGAGGDDTANSSSGNPTMAGGMGGDVVFPAGVGGGSSGGGCGVGCSADLKKVIDCNGNVISTCTGDQGCANGVCINDPCQAAEVSKSSYGCDYWSLKTELIAEGAGACFAAFVANTWSTPVHLQVEYQGQPLSVASFTRIPQGQGQGLTYAPYDPAAGLPPGEVAILFLAQGPNNGSFMPTCPIPPALPQEAAVTGTGLGNAFHIVADRPIVAYQILPYGGGSSAATSATLLLPTSAWDTNYIAVNAYKQSVSVPQAAASLDVLAHQDNTKVTLLPKVFVQSGNGVPGGAAGQPITYTLNRGQYLQITQSEELTGSPIQSDKPIAIWGGATCLSVPVDGIACDSAQQQIPPIRALGNEYAGVRYKGRAIDPNEAPPWRMVGAVDGTNLTWIPGPPPGAPSTLGLGEVAEFNSPGPFVVASQDKDHPFYLASYMTGGGNFDGEGDPEWVNVIPTAQYLDSYVLFTDPTYSETSLVVVRRPSSAGTFAEVKLDCAGTLTGWQPIGKYEYTRVDLVTGNFQNVGNCSNGRHEMSSDLPFGVTVWGWGTIPGFPGQGTLFTQYVSYAYPAGASVQSINDVVIPPVPK